MDHVTLLSLSSGQADGVKTGSSGTSTDKSAEPAPRLTAEHLRVPVLRCRDALRQAGAQVSTETAHSDQEIDAALDGPGRVIVAVETVGQLRAVLRRLVRRYAPAPSSRPTDLPADRTLPDLPPIGVLPLAGLGAWLGVPTDPAVTAAAVLGGRTQRLDLLRNDAGSVTLDGVLLGGADTQGRAVRYGARVEVDDVVLTNGRDPLLAITVANADGYAAFDGLPLVIAPSARDGVLDVAIALPVQRRRLLGRRFGRPGAEGEVEVEVRRARGRAVSVTPAVEVPFLDDGVAGRLARKRTWWMERASWAVYVP